MGQTDLSWAVPVMRAGYAGRGIVYLVVAGFSLYAIWWGGQAKGTSSAFGQLEDSAWGTAVLFLIFIGMFAYALWRLVAALYDLECRGASLKGIGARVGMAITGIIHLGLGALAFSLLFLGSSGESGGSSGPKIVGWVLGLPGGRWIVMGGGALIFAAGLYYMYKGWAGKYREHLQANPVTLNFNPVLKAGLIAQGIVICIVGILFINAGFNYNPNEAGGSDKAFSWLTSQVYGQILVAAICVGLLGFSLFCFVNARYRIVPRVSGDDVETMAAKLKAMAQ
ncbi:DUF1206 domain-containing protein [Fulvimarina sp. 2208YS6-2-32]|uniref:DUF1206 domain-containing protein n=1 Tax=Fulvimarina uroteuthidis TaxID=3098149 RepID=A0ABU5I6P8_9HYPH|nr:DUF1206 domain-containing protein [Fulvimarina sp. 2208YS6-2-32]MDY8111058.1 DUF1206 domain-containing protein [Fulvimarina sp. 2208YS6-2-32]